MRSSIVMCFSRAACLRCLSVLLGPSYGDFTRSFRPPKALGAAGVGLACRRAHRSAMVLWLLVTPFGSESVTPPFGPESVTPALTPFAALPHLHLFGFSSPQTSSIAKSPEQIWLSVDNVIHTASFTSTAPMPAFQQWSIKSSNTRCSPDSHADQTGYRFSVLPALGHQ
jgi:hypothetical protein